MLNIGKLLEEMKESPYEEVIVRAPHCGVIHFEDVELGARVSGAAGQWKEKPGTCIAVIEREHNKRPIEAVETGELTALSRDLEGQFVEAHTPLATIRHFLSKDEVLKIILQKALYLFCAPERAKYYFIPEVEKNIQASGSKSIKVRDGLELFIMSRMKREAPLAYSGPEGVIYAKYFERNENIDTGRPLIGVCPESQLPLIEDVVLRVQTEWEERE